MEAALKSLVGAKNPTKFVIPFLAVGALADIGLRHFPNPPLWLFLSILAGAVFGTYLAVASVTLHIIRNNDLDTFVAYFLMAFGIAGLFLPSGVAVISSMSKAWFLGAIAWGLTIFFTEQSAAV